MRRAALTARRVRRRFRKALLGQLLQRGLWVGGRNRCRMREMLALDEARGCFESLGHVDRSDDRLERRGKDGRALLAVRRALALAQAQQRADANSLRRLRQRGPRDQRRSPARKPALGFLREAIVQRPPDDQAQSRIAEELEALVGLKAGTSARFFVDVGI